MNKILKGFSAVVLVATMTLPLITSCASQPKEYKLVELDVEKDLVYGEDISSYLTAEKIENVKAFIYSGYEKILSEEQHEGASKEIEVYAAKNESESVVASLFATSAESGVEFKIGRFPKTFPQNFSLKKLILLKAKIGQMDYSP